MGENNNDNIVPSIIIGLLIMLGLILTSSNAIFVDDGIVRNESGDSIINPADNSLNVRITSPTGNNQSSLTIESYYDACVQNSHGDECYTVHKFGHSDNIGTTITPVADALTYQTPTTLTTLEIVSSSASDTAGGVGARTVKVTGLSTNWSQITEEVQMNGTTPVTLSNQFYRVFRASVLKSGTYATQTAGSHVGDITIRTAGAGPVWATIDASLFPLGQTEIGVYTVPAGYRGYILSYDINVDGNKAADVYLYKRVNASDTTPPYTPMTIMDQVHGVTGEVVHYPRTIINDMPETTDVGFMAVTDTGTTGVAVNFELLLLKNE